MTFQQIRNNSKTVNEIMKRGGTLEDCIVGLYLELEATKDEAFRLSALAPRKIIAEDGKAYVWHCPDDLIPATRL